MSNIFMRGPLTDWLLDYLDSRLSELGKTLLIGDAVAPEEAGWTGGQPGQGAFRPYTVVTTAAASHNQQDTLGVSDTSWRAMYSLRSVGGSRQQAEWAADQSRRALNVARKVGLDLGDDWQVQQARYENLGPVTRNDTTNPPYWEVTDSVALWLERS